jgi:phospholipid/cholesterol/gamma-HCH transport system permease protein
MVIGRAGSAMCAEIGIMRNSEQIDSLECMAIDPYRFIIVPKFGATIISMPVLTFIFNMVGILGGYVVGVALLGLTSGAYFQGMYQNAVWADVKMGLVKSMVFAVMVVWICTSKGFFLHSPSWWCGSVPRRGSFCTWTGPAGSVRRGSAGPPQMPW